METVTPHNLPRHSFALPTGHNVAVYHDGRHDIDATADFCVQLFHLMDLYHQHAAGILQIEDAVRSQSGHVTRCMQNRGIDLNAFIVTGEHHLTPFFFEGHAVPLYYWALAGATQWVGEAFYKSDRVAFGNMAFSDGFARSECLLEFLKGIDYWRFGKFPAAAGRMGHMQDAYRFACSLPQQPIVVRHSAQGNWKTIAPTTTGYYTKTVERFLRQRTYCIAIEEKKICGIVNDWAQTAQQMTWHPALFKRDENRSFAFEDSVTKAMQAVADGLFRQASAFVIDQDRLRHGYAAISDVEKELCSSLVAEEVLREAQAKFFEPRGNLGTESRREHSGRWLSVLSRNLMARHFRPAESRAQPVLA